MGPPRESAAWQLGVQSYLDQLQPEQRLTFLSPANPNDCLELIKQAQTRNRKFDRLTTTLRPLIEPLKRFEASIDVIVQTYPTVASPIWGPIRVVLTVLHERQNTLHNVILVLERLVEPLKRFHDYEVLFQSNEALRRCIGALYCDLIEFCTRIVAHHTKGPFLKSQTSFDKDITEISEKLRHHWIEVDTAANAANLLEAKTARFQDQLHYTLELRRDINHWLHPTNVEDDLFRLQASYMLGSCDWLSASSGIQNLIGTKTSCAVRICGYPGCGKSVAASYLIKHLQLSSDSIVLYFFCKSTDAERSFVLNVIRTLIWQLLQYDDQLYTNLRSIYVHSGRPIADSESLVLQLFDEVLASTAFRMIYIVIDALDECHDAESLAQILRIRQKEAKVCFKLVTTTRIDPLSNQMLDFCDSEIQLNANVEYFTRYVKQRIGDFPLPVNDEQRQKVCKAVLSAADGLWLFARLLLDELEKSISIQDMYNQIATVPDRFAQLYTSIVSGKEKSLTKAELKLAQNLYLWLKTSDYMPEEIWRRHGGTKLNDEIINVIMKSATRSEHDVFNPMQVVQKLCSPLIEVTLTHELLVVLRPIDGQIPFATFVAEVFHQTAEQYFKWCDEASISDIPIILRPRRLAELRRGAAAVWYFTKSSHFKDVLHHLRERPRSGYGECYLEMACSLWQSLQLENLRRDLTLEETEEAEDLCEEIIQFVRSEQCLPFIEMSIILQFCGQSNLLMDNITAVFDDTLSLSVSCQRKFPFLRGLMDIRRSFLNDVSWCLLTHLSAIPLLDHAEYTSICPEKPLDFDKRLIAQKTFVLARQYQWLALPSRARSNNGFLLNGRS